MAAANLDALIELTNKEQKITELPTDIEEAICSTGKPGCIRCKVCGFLSGTTRKLQHFIDCKYRTPEMDGPFEKGERLVAENPIDPSVCEAVLQREYAKITPRSIKKILATRGADTCIIVAMRDRKKFTTILAHIDDPTRNKAIDIFLDFDPYDTDVYVVGGSTSSKDQINQYLRTLQDYGFGVTFGHIIDLEENAFAIDCRTGETWLDLEISVPDDLPITINKETRGNAMEYMSRLISPGPLQRVKIPTLKLNTAPAVAPEIVSAAAAAAAQEEVPGQTRRKRRNTRRVRRTRRKNLNHSS